ncbi:MAG: YchE family NAAT transporter [Gammaproteobacteria bacterium]|nr:YchE family NAAT transporter [Gammaproteobacteria bacterium]
MLEYTEYTKMLIGLIAIVNPIGAVPIFISLTSGYKQVEKNAISKTATYAVFIILIFALAVGEMVLSFFGITFSSFRVAGGILILLMAISMMHAKTNGIKRTEEEEQESEYMDSIAVVPLAIPLLAGPGAISTVILYAHKDTGLLHYFLIGLIILAVSLILYLAFKSIPYISKYLSQTAVNVFSRIMGLILAAIAIEFIANGIKGLFPNLV